MVVEMEHRSHLVVGDGLDRSREAARAVAVGRKATGFASVFVEAAQD